LNNYLFQRIGRIAVVSLLTASGVSAADVSRLVFTKSFPGSIPPYVEISVQQNGEAEYKEDPNDENPLKFKLSEADATTMFDISDKLNHFTGTLESGMKVAFMGKKTFRWEGAGGPHSATFNYSEDLDTKTLLDWFERIAETERALIDLERSVRFDKLGVQDSILRIEVTRNQKRLVAEEQFLPLLDRVVKNEKYLHMARARAAALSESIRASK
jgi:hypothetical protein